MKIAVIVNQDHAGQAFLLARGLRDYTSHDAYCIRQQNTYMDFPTDFHDLNRHRDKLDAADLLIVNDDFYWQYWETFLNKPCIVKCHGTFTRHNTGWYQSHFERTGTLFVTSPIDSLSRHVGFSAQHIPPMTDHRLLPTPDPSTDKIVVGTTGRSQIPGTQKGTDAVNAFLAKVKALEHVEVDRVDMMPWQGREVNGVYVEGCLDRKKRWHVCVDNLAGAYGVTAIESLMLGQLVVANLNPWVQSFYTHDVPPFCSPDYVYKLFEKPALKSSKTGDISHQWALRNHDLSTQIPKWNHIIEWRYEQWQQSKIKTKPPSLSPTTPTTTRKKATRRSRKRSKRKGSK